MSSSSIAYNWDYMELGETKAVFLGWVYILYDHFIQAFERP